MTESLQLQEPSVRHSLQSAFRNWDEKSWVLFVFAFASITRLIPQAVAYPFPIGYDVVNYYIPVTAHFEQHWQAISGQFPLYAILLRFAYLLSGMDASSVVSAMAVAIYGAFATSLYLAGRTAFCLRRFESIILSIFVVAQLAVLRTTWDLHRDMLALTAGLFAVYFIYRSGETGRWRLVGWALCGLAAASDRMIGTFLAATIIIWFFISRDRNVAVPAVIALGTVLLLSLSSAGTVFGNIVSEAGSANSVAQAEQHGQYNFENLRSTFLEIDGILLVPAVYGLYKSKALAFRIATIVSMVGALSWLVFPTVVQLAADRWIILSGIFMSIQAAYGIIVFSRQLRQRMIERIVPLIAVGLSLAFATMYATFPYDRPISTLAFMRGYVESFVPTTMQFSTIDVQKTAKLLAEIDAINNSTEPNAIIVGDKSLSGFMEMHLKDGRSFQYSDDLAALLAHLTEDKKVNVYQFKFDDPNFLVKVS